MRPPGEPPPPPPAAFAEPRPVAPSRPEEAAGDEEIRWSKPINSGAYPVQGYSLEELVKGIPEFAPIEGLPEEVWHKPRSTLAIRRWRSASSILMADRKKS
jgi:hypothetical protein